MITSLIVIEGESVNEDNLRISLMNAKQLVLGNIPRLGIVVNLAANTPDDLRNALIDFSKIQNVTGVITLMLRSS